MPLPIIAAAGMKAAPYILQGLSALGGVFGKKKKHMDSETLRQLYGPRAVSKDTQELVNFILNSPHGQQLLASAAEQGQGLQTDMAQRAAMSGLSPDTGGSSGASDFQVSAATQAQTGLERGVKANIYQSAMPIAADMVGGRMQNALQAQAEENATPSTMQRIGAAAGQVAAAIPAPGAAPATGVGAVSRLAMPSIAGNTQLGIAPQLQAPNQAPSQFQGPQQSVLQGALTNSKSAGMKRGLVGRRK